MGLERRNVLAAAISDKAYTDGYELFKNNAVDIYFDDRDIHSKYTIKGTVRGKPFISYTSIVANKDFFESGFCTCRGASYGGYCKHQVAVALKWLKLHENDDYFDVVTDPDFESLVESYKHADVYESSVTESDKKLHAELGVSFKTSMPQLSLRVGYDRLYVIKNLNSFYYAFMNHEEFSLGKNLSIIPKEEDFADEDLPKIQFFLKKAEDNIYMSDSYKTTVKMLDMSPSDCDEVFSMYEGKDIYISGGHEKKQLPVIKRDPKIKLTVSPLSSGNGKVSGISIQMDNVLDVFPGRTGAYLLRSDAINCCSKKFRETCYEFILYMCDIQNSGRKGLPLAKKDIPVFCANILPCIRDYVIIVDGDAFLNEYTPEKLDVTFYFDMPDEQALTCEVRYKYGEKDFNPLHGDSTGIMRDERAEKKVEGLLDKYFKIKDFNSSLLIQDDEELIFELLDNNFSEFMKLGTVYVTDAIKRVHISNPPQVTVGVKIDGDLLNLKVDADGLSGEELHELLNGYREKRHFFRLKNGDFIRYNDDTEEDDDPLASVNDLVDGLRLKNKDISSGVSLPKNRAFYINEVAGKNKRIDSQVDDVYRNIIRSLEPGKKKEYTVPEGLKTELRGYQVEGFKWLMSLHEYGFGGILADDMGLGKTVQIIAMLLKCQGEGRTSLVCCPASLVYNWYSEVRRFAPSLKCEIVAGNQEERIHVIRNYKSADLLITSYDVLRRDIEYYEKCHFTFQIVDEAQFIKNQNTKKAHAVKEINADTKFALTGTPIENRLSELWSIFDYLMPGYLYSYQMFKAVIETPVVKEHLPEPMERLHKLIAPFILRRLKKDVLKDLPDKIEEVVYAQMEGEQKKLYAAVTDRLISSLNNASDATYNTGKIEVLAELTRLRQLCCDPALVYENYTAGSVKLEACMELVEQGIDGGHKILLFSQFTSMLDIIAKKLIESGIRFYMLTGETPAKTRLSMVDAFQMDDTPVFLISLKAGGTGLNLTAADIVIHYDPWWNIAVQNQATDRSHRIGQENTVNVYKLVVKDTIEDKILALQEAKKQLADDILSGEQTSIASLGREELLELLK